MGLLLAAVVVAGALTTPQAGARPAGASRPEPTLAAQVFARGTEVTAQARLVYKPDATTPTFEGGVVVIAQSRGLIVVDARSTPSSPADPECPRGNLRRDRDPGQPK